MLNSCDFIFGGGPCELPLTGDLWDREQEQPRNQGITQYITMYMNHNTVMDQLRFMCVIFDYICFLFPALRR